MSLPVKCINDWRKWGLGGSITFGPEVELRLWLGPLRIGTIYITKAARDDR